MNTEFCSRGCGGQVAYDDHGIGYCQDCCHFVSRDPLQCMEIRIATGQENTRSLCIRTLQAFCWSSPVLWASLEYAEEFVDILDLVLRDENGRQATIMEKTLKELLRISAEFEQRSEPFQVPCGLHREYPVNLPGRQ